MIERLLLKYKILEEVGHGGMAVVYRGLDTTLDREVAIKILHAHLAEDEESKRRFQREAHAVAKLRHDNIIEIFDYSGLDSSESFIVTEFIHGQTLKDYMARHPISHPEIAAMIIVEVCTALAHAHSLGVIHRDIKPENIMIRDDGRVKLTDFGIAQVVDVQRLTVTGQLLGSPAYMAPELVEGKRLDFRTDVFSVGTLCYQLATSELPFKGKNPHEVLKRIADGRYLVPEVVNPVVGTQLSHIIQKALAHDPGARYASAMKLKEDLMEYLAEVEISDPRAELVRYFTSPAEYSRELQQRVVKILTGRGKSALERHRTPRALEYFNRILCTDPANKEVLNLLDRITRRRRLGRAIASLSLVFLLGGGSYYLSSIWPKSGASAVADGRPAELSSSDARARSLPRAIQIDSRSDGSAVSDGTHLLRFNRLLKVTPPLSKQVEIIPSPKAVTIWLNGKQLGQYGPDLRSIRIPSGTSSKLVFRNDACCFERVVEIGPKEFPEVLRVKLPWKPARIMVQLSPAVEADVLIGTLVTRPGQPVEVPIPDYSEDGKDEVAIKVSSSGFATEIRKVAARANTTVTVPVTLRRLP
jgi:eukaryotic-like serine/threonine-protein kinase